MDVTGIGEVATAAQKILGMIFPDKTQEEKDKLAAAMAMLQSQTAIDQAEAQSTDPLQHWRGGLGWVCTLAYLNNFLLTPWALAFGLHVPAVDIGPLAVLTAGMLGLGGMHVYQQTQGK
jgi:Holin of 3TMs, for gene-transfer release